MYHKHKGLTLIEFMVAMAVVAVLAVIVLARMSQVRADARDGKRIADLQDFTAGMDLYYDKYKKYPCGDYYGVEYPGGTADSSFSLPFLDGLGPSPTQVAIDNCIGTPTRGLYTEGYHPNLWHKDPINSYTVGYGYFYYVPFDRSKFILLSRLERHTDLMANDGGVCNNYYELGPYVGDIAASTFDALSSWWAPCNI